MSTNTTKTGKDIGIKSLFIAGLVVFLAFSLGLQDSLVLERRHLRDEAVARTVEEWGGRQRLFGPLIRVPYREEVVTRDSNGYEKKESRSSFAYLLPDSFTARTDMRGETRKRGIYEIPLYLADLSITGTFAIPEAKAWMPSGAIFDPGKAELLFFLASARGLAEQPKISLGSAELAAARAGLGDYVDGMDAFTAPIGIGPAGTRHGFGLELKLKGGESFALFPAGSDSVLSVQMDSGAPEFGGDFLPTSRDIRERGFSADWNIPILARRIPRFWTADTWDDFFMKVQYASFRLDLDMDGYQLLNRAMKYGLLFIVVPFIGLFLYELLARKQLHPLQYLLVGCAVVMFYMITLSLSERMDFGLAFIIGALAICALLGVYCAAILRGGLKGLWCFLGMGGLYGLLYLIISSEDNALIVGTAFLLALLASIMLATRKIDWYELGGKGKAARGGDGGAPV